MDITLRPRAEASRRNGAKSRGPKSPEGKARSAQNALKHGLRAEKFVLLHDEDAAAFEAMAEALTEDLAPVGALQALLARRVVVAAWRLERAARIERELRELHEDAALPAPPQDAPPIEPEARADAGEIAPAPPADEPRCSSAACPAPPESAPCAHPCVRAHEATQKCATMRHLCATHAPPSTHDT
jgi:hypothetical protein